MAAAAASAGGRLPDRVVAAGRAVRRITVAIAEYKVGGGEGGPALLASGGLGSCVGLTLFDPEAHVGGLAHILLPAARRDGNGCVLGNPGKYVDTCVVEMLGAIEQRGGRRTRLQAKLAGGANMFSTVRESLRPRSPVDDAAETVAPVGERNVAAVREVLAKMELPLVAEDTGGHHGRSLEFDTETGVLTVSTAQNVTTTL